VLLFAIVLGLAAVAAAVADRSTTRHAPSASPPRAAARGAQRQAAALIFDASRPRRRLGLEVGRRAELIVRVAQPGQVTIPGLGLTDSAEKSTPAQFDVLTDRQGRYELVYMPAAAEAGRPAGVLVVTAARSASGSLRSR
jgi:hypothetical protein